MGNLTWRRMRYGDAAQACAALAMLAEAGATIDLRLRHLGEIVTLHVGLGERWASVLEQMAPDFGLDLSADLKAGVAGAPEPGPLTGSWAPGAWAEWPGADADARLVAPGVMQVRQAQVRQSHGASSVPAAVSPVQRFLTALRPHPRPAATLGAPVALGVPVLGVAARPELPLPARCPKGSAWRAGVGGFGAPACLIGADSAVRALVLRLAEVALGEQQPTVIVDGTGELVRVLREMPAVRRLVGTGQVMQLSIARAGQHGFNPLMEASVRGAERTVTQARWRWWLRGLGVYEPALVEAAYAGGVRTLAALLRWWSGRADTLLAAHAVQALLSVGDVAVWLNGNVDVVGHLQAGGHLVVECPRAEGARLQALRGLVGLAAEGGARLLSLGVRWPADDAAMLVRLSSVCSGHSWEDVVLSGRGQRLTTVLARSEAALGARVAVALGHTRLGEWLATLPGGVGLVQRDGEWWRVGRGAVAGWAEDNGAEDSGGEDNGAEDSGGEDSGAEDSGAGDGGAGEALEIEEAVLAGEVEQGAPRAVRRPALLEAYGATAAESLACVRAVRLAAAGAASA